jgi:hypothetical protein
MLYNSKDSAGDPFTLALRKPIFSRMKQHFSVSVDSPVEFVVCISSFVEGEVMRDDNGWFCPPGNDKVTEVAVICLDAFISIQR